MHYMKLIPQLKMNSFSRLVVGLFTVAKLIGCEIEDLKLTFSTRKMKVGNDNIVQKLTLSQVNDYSANIYLCLQLWLEKVQLLIGKMLGI